MEPILKSGGLWYVAIVSGSRKKGTRTEIPVSEPVYTLAQAQTFCNNNKVTDFTKSGAA
jgi:hypothetical protein